MQVCFARRGPGPFRGGPGEALEERARKKGVRNVETVCSTWEEYEGPTFDEVCAAYVGEACVDSGLRKMVEHSRRGGVIVAPASDVKDDFGCRELFRMLGKSPPAGGKSAREVERWLNALGLAYESEEVEYEFGQPLNDFDEAVRFIIGQFGLGAEDGDVVERFLEGRLVVRPGYIYLPNRKRARVLRWRI